MEESAVIDDKYRLLQLLGRGGFGRVYSARHLQLNRVVALKMLDCSTSDTPVVLARFEREALTLSSLRHRNILMCYGYGTWMGSPYIEMEFLDGQSLEARVRERGQLTFAEMNDIILQVCAGLACAHANGIVHRDLKPGNVMLVAGEGETDIVKIIDFGLAKFLPTFSKEVQKLTDVGTAIGTVMYMSPEQCLGAETTSSADIYAVGCIIQYCLTGLAPFEGALSASVMRSHVGGNLQRLKQTRPELLFPEGIQDVIDHCVQKLPSARYANISELADDLKRIAAGELPRASEIVQHAHQASPGKRQIIFFVAVVAVLLMTLAAVVLVPNRVRERAWITLHGRTNDEPVSAMSSSQLLYRAAKDDRTLVGQPRMAVDMYEAVLRADEYDNHLGKLRRAQVLSRLASLYMETGDHRLSYARAVHALSLYNNDNLPHDSSFYGVTYNALCALNMQKCYREAIRLGAKEIREEESKPVTVKAKDRELAVGKIKFQMGWVAFLAGEFEQSESLLKQLPHSKDAEFEQNRLTLAGEIDLVHGRWKQAYEKLNYAKSLRDPPGEWRLWPSLVRAEIGSGMWKVAESDLAHVVHKECLYGLNALFAAHRGEWDDSRKNVMRIVRLVEAGHSNVYATYAFIDMPWLVQMARQDGQHEVANQIESQYQKVLTHEN